MHKLRHPETYDTQLEGVPGNRTVVAETRISEQELLTKLKELNASRVLLIFNACHSGEISPTLDANAEPPLTGANMPDATTAALLATGAGRIIITACRDKQFSFVGDGQQTIFGQTLVDTLQGQGVTSQHGYISTFDLYTALYAGVGAAVQRAVPEATRKPWRKARAGADRAQGRGAVRGGIVSRRNNPRRNRFVCATSSGCRCTHRLA